MALPPPLSVLLPVRNGEAVIRNALGSLARQTYADFEVVAVDDGSTDGTWEILQSMALADPRIRPFARDAQGIVPALEFARAQARGRFLARMDADDGAFSQRFERQMELMEAEPRIGLCGVGIAYFPREVVRTGARRYETWINGLVTHEEMMRDLFVECPIPHPTFMMRADFMALVGGYRDRGWPEDYDLVLRLWEGGCRFGKVPEVLLRWREGDGRLSRTHPAYSDEAFRRCKVHHLLRTHLRGRRPAIVWGAGPIGKSFAREILAQGGVLQAFVDVDPRKVGQEIYGVRVLSAKEALEMERAFSLAAVGKGRGRAEIRDTLRGAGRVEARDFVAVS